MTKWGKGEKCIFYIGKFVFLSKSGIPQRNIRLRWNSKFRKNAFLSFYHLATELREDPTEF